MYFSLNKLSSRNVCDIIEDSIDRSIVEDFVNPIGVDVLVNVYAAGYLFDDRKDEIMERISDDVFSLYDELLKDGTFKKMYEKFPDDMKTLETYSHIWLDKYSQFSSSSVNVVNKVFESLDSGTDEMAKKLSNLMRGEASEIFSIADKWGMNNVPPTDGE